MGLLISRGYINSTYTLKPSGSPDTSTSHVANSKWILDNYELCMSGNLDYGNRCPSSDELTTGFGYYNCGYGCQCYVSDPSCTPCSPFIF